MSWYPKAILSIVIAIGLFIATTVVISKHHPIFAKWVFQTARCIGRPIKANVFTDGKSNNKIAIYHVNSYWGNEKTDNFIITLHHTLSLFRVSLIAILFLIILNYINMTYHFF